MTADRDKIIAAARLADSGFDGAPDADGTMSDSIVGIEAVTRFYAIAVEAGRQEEREACAKACDEIAEADNGYWCAMTIRARSTK